nr:hypothetical protein [Tanacetum cinerariifolium]
KEVFSVATNSKLNVARFTEMTVPHTDVKARCLKLEAELAKLRNTSHHDNQEELINRFSKLEVKPKVLAPGKHAMDDKPIIPRLRNNKDAHLDYLRHLKESVETIRDIVQEAKVVRPLDRSMSLLAVILSTLKNYWNMRLALVLKALNNELNKLLTFLSLGKSKLLLPNHLLSQIVTHTNML